MRRKPRGVTVDEYVRLNEGLERLLERKVDLVSERCMNDVGCGQRFCDNVRRELVLV